MSARPSASAAVPVVPCPSVDIERVLFDANSLFNPLHKDFMLDFHVSGVKDGYVYLSLAVPEGMTRVFVSLLESLTGLFRCINLKTRAASARAKCVDPADVLRREGQQETFRQEVLSVFDGLIGQGLTVKDAVKRTNSALKAQGNPWATYEVVQSIVRAAGRFRTKRGVMTHEG
jgi:hypothetical protein